MDKSQARGEKSFLGRMSKRRVLKEANKKGRVVLEVLAKEKDANLRLLAEVLRSEGWIYEDEKLKLTFPRDVISSGNYAGQKVVYDAVARMRYLLGVAGIEHNVMVISETSSVKIEENKNTMKLKIGLIGDPGVGKTSLIRRFVIDQFDDRYVETIGAKVAKKEIRLPISKSENLRVNMMIWDIVGDKSIADLYIESHFKGMQGILAVCDGTRPRTLSSIDGWTSSVFQVTGNVPTHILINKADLEDQFDVGKSDVRKYSRSLHSPFMFTSAKTGKNVERAFCELAQKILLNRDRKHVLVANH